MIPAKQTNFLYFSKLLTTTDKYSRFWKNLKSILDTENIEYDFLDNTNDVWCKDYMPIQIDKGNFVQFVYDPDYLKTPDSEGLKTNPAKVTKNLKLGHIELSDMIVEGSNLVNFEKKVAVCDKIFRDNSFLKDKESVIGKLKEYLNFKEILILPTNRDDIFGQASTAVRYMNDNTLIVVDSKIDSKAWTKSVDRVLQEADLHLIDFPGDLRIKKSKNDPTTAFRCYINFILIGNVIIFPQFDVLEDQIALNAIKKLYPVCKVYPLDCCDIALDGGVLDSLAWAIKI